MMGVLHVVNLALLVIEVVIVYCWSMMTGRLGRTVQELPSSRLLAVCS